MKQIIVTIDAEGNTSVETKGFKGQGCKAASKALEMALGTRESDKPTPEAFGSEGVSNSVKW